MTAHHARSVGVAPSWRDRLLATFDDELRDEMVTMTRDLVDIPSATGEEAHIAAYAARRFAAAGMDVELQEVEDGRPNVIGRLRGAGGGLSLLLNGHFDTSTSGDEPNLPFGLRPEARVLDGWIYGLGVSNMKSAHAAYHGAISAISRAGLRLAGDLLYCGVVGEIEKAPVDRYEGRRYRGGGVGTMYAAHHGVLADAAVIGEPTGLRLQTGNTSYAFARVETRGVAQHTWSKERGVDAIERAVRLFAALKGWEVEFEAMHPHPRMGGRLAVSAIEGGFPFKPSIAPAPFCALYLDLRFPPDVPIVRVRGELQAFLDGLRRNDPTLETDLRFYLCRTGYEVPEDEPIANAVAAAHHAVTGGPPARPDPYRHAVSADASILHEYGVRCVTYGPGGIDRQGGYRMYDEHGELCSIDNIVTAAKVYALVAASYCGVTNDA